MRFILVLLLITQLVFGQTDSTKTKKEFKFEEEFSIYGFKTKHYGNNFLNKANKPEIAGFGAQLVLFKVHDLGFGIGGDLLSYRVTDKALGGNIERSNIKRLYGKLIYYVNINEDIRIEPLVGYDKFIIQQRSGDKKFGRQEGNAFIIGTNVTYKIDKTLAFFIGIEYLKSKIEVNTNPEFETFFNQSKQLNLKLGILLR